MKKGDKKLLLIAILGTLVILGMAFVDRWLYPDPLPPGVAVVSAPVESAAEDDGSKPEAASDAEIPSDAAQFSIDPSRSEVRFTLNEVLGGEPTTVVGVTNLVSGTFSVPMDAPQNAHVGEILVNARGFATDNSFRNRAIHDVILQSGAYENISFIPTEITPLPEAVSIGESFSLEISGDLTIKGVTHEVTFTANMTLISETEISGHAEVVVSYEDYGISIPSVPRVADVDEEALLEIDFVALLATE